MLQTAWDQLGAYAHFSPEQQVLGCWSTALAQILYYHLLLPTGIVDYNCSKGYVIRDTLSYYNLPWQNFTARIDENSTPEAALKNK